MSQPTYQRVTLHHAPLAPLDTGDKSIGCFTAAGAVIVVCRSMLRTDAVWRGALSPGQARDLAHLLLAAANELDPPPKVEHIED